MMNPVLALQTRTMLCNLTSEGVLCNVVAGRDHFLLVFSFLFPSQIEKRRESVKERNNTHNEKKGSTRIWVLSLNAG